MILGRGQEEPENEGYFRVSICKLLRNPGIDSGEPIPPVYVSGGPVRQIGLSYLPARLENRFLGSLKGLQIRVQGLKMTWDVADSIPYLISTQSGIDFSSHDPS
jgi:hypothetical protein